MDGASVADDRLDRFAPSGQNDLHAIHHAGRSGRSSRTVAALFSSLARKATRKHLPPSGLELVPALSRFVPPAAVIDKPAYSAFSNPGLASLLIDKNVGTVVITGAETDVCVLSTVLSAVDLGFRVVIVEDALCSSSDVGHDALMTMYRTRFHGQVDLMTAEELAEFWRE
ncbi:nicotinamidase-related amidase [Bradyrhizobium sp. GM5.1]